MRKILFALALFCLMSSAFIQTAEAHSPPPPDTIYIKIDNHHIIPLNRLQMDDFKVEWVKDIFVLKEDKHNLLERGKVVIVPKKRFRKKILEHYKVDK